VSIGCRANAIRLARIAENRYYARSFSMAPASSKAAGNKRNGTQPRLNKATKDFVTMANTAQARKRARQAEATRQRNASLKSSLRTAIKKVRKAIGAGDKAAATKELQAQQSVIDRIADKKVVHKNTASRSKARLAQAIKALP
jgi:small subunit ribosomal protein S20